MLLRARECGMYMEIWIFSLSLSLFRSPPGGEAKRKMNSSIARLAYAQTEKKEGIFFGWPSLLVPTFMYYIFFSVIHKGNVEADAHS